LIIDSNFYIDASIVAVIDTLLKVAPPLANWLNTPILNVAETDVVLGKYCTLYVPAGMDIRL
jgi:hypothetical protein